MAARYIGTFTRYIPYPNPYPTAVHMQNEKGVDLYEARDRMGEGVFFITAGVNTKIVGASVFPFVAIPFEGGMLWHDPDAPANPAAMLGQIISASGEYSSAPPPVSVVTKMDIWDRLSTDEAASVYADIQDAPAAFRGVYESRTEFSSDSNEFATLHTILTNRFGAARAAQILA